MVVRRQVYGRGGGRVAIRLRALDQYMNTPRPIEVDKVLQDMKKRAIQIIKQKQSRGASGQLADPGNLPIETNKSGKGSWTHRLKSTRPYGGVVEAGGVPSAENLNSNKELYDWYKRLLGPQRAAKVPKQVTVRTGKNSNYPSIEGMRFFQIAFEENMGATVTAYETWVNRNIKAARLK